METMKLLMLAGVCSLAAISMARADNYVDLATKAAKAATARVDKWDGPMSGPTAVKGKKIVFVAADKPGHDGESPKTVSQALANW